MWSMDNNMWEKFELECLLLIFIHFNLKFKATRKNGNFQCCSIRNHSKEEKKKRRQFLTSHLASRIFASIFWYLLATLSALESTFLDETSRYASRWFILAQRTQNLEFVNHKYVTYTQPIIRVPLGDGYALWISNDWVLLACWN